MTSTWLWVVLASLGAYHGLNPAMGWLFALALGLQEKRRAAVLAALLPIALGHAAAIAAAILVFHFVQHLVSIDTLKRIVAAILFALGLYRLFRSSHPRGAGIRVNRWELAVWSFMMASAHGAGLMLIPVLLAQPAHGMTHSMPEAMSGGSSQLNLFVILLAALVHTGAMLLVAAILAIVFFETYEKSGLELLRRAWFNFDLIWAIALLVAGFAALWP
jgi:hypothetical protein